MTQRVWIVWDANHDSIDTVFASEVLALEYAGGRFQIEERPVLEAFPEPCEYYSLYGLVTRWGTFGLRSAEPEIETLPCTTAYVPKPLVGTSNDTAFFGHYTGRFVLCTGPDAKIVQSTFDQLVSEERALVEAQPEHYLSREQAVALADEHDWDWREYAAYLHEDPALRTGGVIGLPFRQSGREIG